MELIEKEKLLNRNKKIIEVIMKEINEKCPDSIDMIAIGGSFCNGDIYEKSDLDLVIISRDDRAGCLDKCFILDDVAMDVYTNDWTIFEQMAEYPHPYVTKLIDLDIIYVHDNYVLKRYKQLQSKLKISMNDDNLVLKNIQNHFNKANYELFKLTKNENDLGLAYRSLANIIREVEFIIYMANKSYVKRGTKRVPEEICSMSELPNDFIKIYTDITNCKSIDEIKDKANKLVGCITTFVSKKGIEYISTKEEKNETEKKELMPNNLFGTYEEIYSNWKNKMIHAVSINSRYLSFVTMSSCQKFYDEMYNMFNIPKIELIANYNSEDLNSNVNSFNKCMEEWLKLYKKHEIEVNYYANLNELENLYKPNKKRNEENLSMYLKELSIDDGIKELDYLRNLPANENGFYNPAETEDLVDEESFRNWLNRKISESKGENLKDGYVPQTIYWVMEKDEIVGIGKLRHYLNEKLTELGGHIGLGISSNCRSKGIGTEALKLLLDKAESFGIEDVLLTNNEDNFASRRIVEKCGGVLETINDGHCKYWINLKRINKKR